LFEFYFYKCKQLILIIANTYCNIFYLGVYRKIFIKNKIVIKFARQIIKINARRKIKFLSQKFLGLSAFLPVRARPTFLGFLGFGIGVMVILEVFLKWS